MKDCPECWYEIMEECQLRCPYCNHIFTQLVYNDYDWE